MASGSQPSDELCPFEAIAGENLIHAGPLNFPYYHPDACRPSPAFQPDASAITLPFSNDVEVLMTAPVTNRSGWATKAAWVQHQAEIKQLYFHEKKSLAEVMRLMEEKHGFRATVKMYKTHIQQWGLDKKNKEFEMKAIVRKYKQRKDQGKSSIIRIRRQVRDYAEVVRYWDRKGVSINDIIARQTSSPTPEAVKFSTPVPSPITTPQVIAIPERIFRCVRDYFKSSFESGTWVSTEPIVFCYSIKAGEGTDNSMYGFYNLFGCACSLFLTNSSHEARQNLCVANAIINKLLSAEHPDTLITFFRSIVNFHGQETDEVSLFVLRQFSGLGKRLLGSEHPLTRICEWSGSVDASDLNAIAIRCMESMADQLQSSVGPMHVTTLTVRKDLISVVAHGWEARIQMLLGDCEKTLRPDDVRILYVRTCIARHYLNRGCYAEAMTLSQKNITHSQGPSSTSAGSYRDEDLYILAKCQYALGEVDLGIGTLLTAINSSMSRWGPQNSRARHWLQLLEVWCFEQGLWDAAAEVRKMSQELLESIDTDGLQCRPIPLDGTNAIWTASSIDDFDDSTN